MIAIEYLKSIPRTWLPRSTERGRGEPSNSVLFRWLKNKAIIINGSCPQPFDDIDLPINELIFFPSGKRRTTMVQE